MPLSAGTRLGPYEILAPIGAGGMGEVYRARDTRLDRIVAIKVSSEQFSERFEREARAVAAFNHPHICQLYDVGPNYIVMEHIEGQTLKGPLPLDQALKYGAQICDALDAAHKKSFTHRDLKPANILVTRTGVKLLDFGLAKRSRGEVAADDATETIALTKANTILGTLQYMSPEQLQGKDADARSDIFAFGAVLYEMVTGQRAFEGASQASVIAAILDRDPAPLSPQPLDRVVAKCLAKDPERRWQSARDLKDELEWIAQSGAPSASAPARNPWRERAAWALAAIFLCAAAVSNWRSSSTGEVTRFTVYPPEKTTFFGSTNATVSVPHFALSPDGRAIILAASAVGAKPMLWLRSMADVDARPLPGTENAQDPFWSPDGRWIGFFSEGKLKRMPAAGGPAQVVAEGLADERGGSWGPDDTILFGRGNNGIYRVPAAGGTPTPVTKTDKGSHRFPQFLPGGSHFLFYVRGGLAGQSGIYAGSLDGQTKKFLVRSNSNALYISPGYLLYLDGDTLLGQAFDPKRLQLDGQPFTVAGKVGYSTFGKAAVSASRMGAVAYSAAILQTGRLTWFDRGGALLAAAGPDGDYIDFRLSPDEKRLAASLVDPKAGYPDIWLTDLARGSTTRFTFGPALNTAPVWSPEGGRLVYRTSRNGVIEFYGKSAAGGGSEEPVLLGETQRLARMESINNVPTDWSPDGRYIICSATTMSSSINLWLLPSGGDKKPVRFLPSASDQMHANFSPDGRFLAYSSNESGRFEVYVQTFPPSERKWQVSTSGGYEPRWRRDGREIYYLSEDRKLMAVSIGAGPSFEVPKPLLQTRVPAGVSALRTNYVPSGDGQRFLVNTQSGDPAPNPITVVLNWTAGMK